MKKRFFYTSLIIAIAILIINFIAYPFLPNKVPVHWGLNGDVDRYGSKMEQLIMSGIPLLLVLFFNLIPSIDPRKESFKLHTKAYSIVNLLVIIFISGLNLLAIISALGYNMHFSIILPILLGILFIGMGNYMSQIRPNYFFGFRTPWALASEQVWKKTHRFGGLVFCITGIIPFSTLLIGDMGMKLFFWCINSWYWSRLFLFLFDFQKK